MSTVTTMRSRTVRHAAAGAPDAALRLTRRGRLVIFLGCLALACGALVMLAGAALGTGESGPPVPTQEVTVHPGDTLWGIAAQADPDADPREVVEEIRELNDLDGAVQAGQKIAVPETR